LDETGVQENLFWQPVEVGMKQKILGYALAIITVFIACAFLACVAILPARSLDAQDVQHPSVPGPPPPPRPQFTRMRVGRDVQAAKLVFHPDPDYPPIAKTARIQGTVRLDAVINRDGTVQTLRVISGHPLLVKAALDAVQRWRYQPTLLNGDPVEVASEIDVSFALPQ
jgi:TonB family protein